MTTLLCRRSFSAVPRVVFENKHVFVLNKPAGIAHHSGQDEDGIVKQIREMQKNGKFSYTGDLFSVHRLDRCTSGLLLFAKSRKAATFFCGAFADRKISKYYVAISNNRPNKKMGKVTGDLVASRRSQMKLTRTDSRPSTTRFISSTLPNSLDQIFGCPKEKQSPSSRAPLRLFLVKPLTGQKHQVRVVLRSLGSAVLGDHLYAKKDDLLERVDRCYLHACGLRLPMPPASPDEKDNDGEDPTSRKYESSKGAQTFVQIVCRPSEGAIFQTPDFHTSWEDWVVPNMIASSAPIGTNQPSDAITDENTISSGIKSPGKLFSVLSPDLPIIWC
ncbi:unnamed protein product [Symbiodinium microadriaticum]|nr:unnamed protein product [Symbiodinium microadriaticum]